MATTPSSTHQYEATVINAPIEAVWAMWRSFNFHAMNPQFVQSTEFIEGAAGAVGSHLLVNYQDGKKLTYCIREISDTYHRVIFELVNAQPPITYHGSQHSVKLYRDSAQNKTFITWETDYTNDVGVNDFAETKATKLAMFAAINSQFT